MALGGQLAKSDKSFSEGLLLMGQQPVLPVDVSQERNRRFHDSPETLNPAFEVREGDAHQMSLGRKQHRPDCSPLTYRPVLEVEEGPTLAQCPVPEVE